jgi:hypothetical protein
MSATLAGTQAFSVAARFYCGPAEARSPGENG